MKIIFTESYESLQEKLSLLDGEWDDSQANKKVFRLNGRVLNWDKDNAKIRVALLSESYLDIEGSASKLFESK